MRPQPVHVLGIESSCDDTGVAIVSSEGHVLSSIVHSQLKSHLNHGGIIPMVAKDYHLSSIDQVAIQAFRQSGLRSVGQDIDAIAVTNRPGLDHSLQVGLNYARQLAKKYFKPLIPVHHMRAHALMPMLENRCIRYPFLALLLSGGHCLLSICRQADNFDLLGESRDDAPGEILDKIARRCRLRNLGDPYDRISGGAAIELLSKRDSANRFKYFNFEESVPMAKSQDCDFSFSGYRGAFEQIVPKIDELWYSGDREKLLDELSHLSGSLQRSMLIQVVKKLQRALAYYRMHWRYRNEDLFLDNGQNNVLGFKTRGPDDNDHLDLVISGGVAANSYFIDTIRNVCKDELDENIRVYAPSKGYCSDNGLMVAWNGLLRYMKYLNEKSSFEDKSIDDSVIDCFDRMDLVKAHPECPIGKDIRQQVALANFSLRRLRYPELKSSNGFRQHESVAG